MSQNVAHIYYGKCHERWVTQLGSTRPLPRSESGLSGFGLGAKALDWAGGKASGAMRRWGCRWLSTAVAAVPRVRVVGEGGGGIEGCCGTGRLYIEVVGAAANR
jgi:hypothetical protein